MTPIPGDCGDEYRKPPFLTASGDLSHHLDAIPSAYEALAARPPDGPARLDGQRVGADRRLQPRGAGERHDLRLRHHRDPCRPAAAWRRAMPARRRPTSSTRSPPRLRLQAARIEDVVRTRVYLRDASKWEPVSRAHGRVFGSILPANTLIEAQLVGDYEVEIEADAIADTPQPNR